MPRLIDADALLMDNTWAFYDRLGDRTSAGLAVEEAPTVDAVEVVRCKDCQHCHAENHDENLIPLPICKLRKEVVSADGYCSDGERRLDESNEQLDERREDG